MTHESANPISTKHPRCRHFTADGTRCRLPVLDASSHLCFRHAAMIAGVSESSPSDLTDLSAELLPQLSEFDSAIDRENLLQLEDAGPPRVELGDMPRPDRSQPYRNAGPTVIWDVPGVNLNPEKAPS